MDEKVKNTMIHPRPGLAAAVLLLGALAGGLAGAVRAADGDTLRKIRDSGEIAVGYRESSVPFSYTDGRQVMGYSHDILLAIVERIKVQLHMPHLRMKLVPIMSKNRFQLVENGTIDIECGTTTNNRERQKVVGFSTNFFIYGLRMLVKKDSGVKDFPDLKNRTVVTTAGTTDERLLIRMNGEKQMNMNLLSVKDHWLAFLILESGRASAFVMDEPLLYGELTKAKSPSDWVVVGTPLQTENYACMFRKDDPSFKKLADGVITEILTSGRGEKLYQKWFNSPVPPRGINLRYPMSPEMKALFAHPHDRAFQ